MSALIFALGCGLLGLAYALALPHELLPASPVGETMRPSWSPHPRTLVALDPEDSHV